MKKFRKTIGKPTTIDSKNIILVPSAEAAVDLRDFLLIALRIFSRKNALCYSFTKMAEMLHRFQVQF
jgi:hypothetical protein